jgi:hypothetical protein
MRIIVAPKLIAVNEVARVSGMRNVLSYPPINTGARKISHRIRPEIARKDPHLGRESPGEARGNLAPRDPTQRRYPKLNFS